MIVERVVPSPICPEPMTMEINIKPIIRSPNTIQSWIIPVP
jgi:hypothetical protein